MAESLTKVGSTSNAVGNSVYTDLTLTRFPESLDTRTGSTSNMNMFRQENMKDYNLAEHVNALQDAIMSIQRALGTKVQLPVASKQVDANGNPLTAAGLLALKQTSTVKARLDEIEGHDWAAEFDKRYGGPDWNHDKGGPTIEEHRHIGPSSSVPGAPGKIVLTEEVAGKLPKANMDLSKNATGITGADIYVEPTSSTKISAAINDKISESAGGTVDKNATINVYGKLNTRWTREFDYTDNPSGATRVADAKTMLGQAIESNATASTYLLNETLDGMYNGRYVAIVRMSSNYTGSAEILEITATSGGKTNKITFKGSDFPTGRDYKTFFLIFDNNGKANLRVRKYSTTDNVAIRLDYAIVEPVHPAVFDR